MAKVYLNLNSAHQLLNLNYQFKNLATANVALSVL